MARIRTGDVKVEGLAALNRQLKALGPEFQKELKKASLSVASFVADDARAAAYAQGGVAAHVAPSIVAKGYTTSAAVAFGGTGFEMAGGAEFGSLKYKQFKVWRGNSSDAGYFLYPAIRQDSDRIVTEYTDALDDLIDRLGLD